MPASLTFLGGAQTVTGSKFLLELGERRILVDCGLFQGLKELRLQNWAPFPVDPKSLDAVIITHAHLDHVGYVPLLVRDGFKGPILATLPTRALARIILLDASRIQEEDAMKALAGGYSKHKNPVPLFSVEDAKASLSQFSIVDTGVWKPLPGGAKLRFTPSGHILGSSFVEISYKGKLIVFSGDLGRAKPLLLPPPGKLSEADVIVVESTYGDRLHPKEAFLRTFSRVLREAVERGGNVLIPSFAVGRSQDLLYLMSQLKAQNELPRVPIYFDSPMGIEATDLLSQFPDWHRLNPSQIKQLRDAATFVTDIKQSFSLSKSRKQKIVIAGSGMMTGGRILNYLEHALPDKTSTILLVGYQALGTRGRQLRDGLPEIKLFGRFISAKAKVVELPGLSAHADQKELIAWLRNFESPERVFLVHGEPQTADVLRLKLKDTLGWDCEIPNRGTKARLF